MINGNGKVWREVAKHLKARREEAVSQLVKEDTDEARTHALRGRITEIDRLLDLPKEQEEAASIKDDLNKNDLAYET